VTVGAMLLCAVALLALSGVPALFMSRTDSRGQRTTTTILIAGCTLGLFATLRALLDWTLPTGFEMPWHVPYGEIRVEVDAISAVFLAPIFLITMMGSIYGVRYWKQEEHPENGRKLGLFYGFVAAGIALLVIARNTILFVAGWEVMALCGYVAMVTEDHEPSVRGSGYLYVVCTRVGTLCLFAIVALLHAATGTFEFVAVPRSLPESSANAVFLLSLVAFGVKAGIVPLHVWLPGAHANAPTHVSAIFSGVLIKMGIYGLVRTLSLFPDPPAWWGGLLLAIGAVSGVLGVAFALAQHDVKRLLAYHSVENIGIIVMGIGLAMIGRSYGNVALIALGLGGGLLHVVNHGLFKSLLFFSAGAVVHSTKTRDIELLGGLLKKMPRAGLLFMIGAVAICGLPPLNGFVSELLVYLGLFHGFMELKNDLTWTLTAAFAAPALALIGALAVACFVKVFGAIFLGEGRSPHVEHAHDAAGGMLGPPLVLATCCAFIGLSPVAVAPALAHAASAFAPETLHGLSTEALLQLAPLRALTVSGLTLAALTALAALVLRRRLRASTAPATPTWDCGYAAPTARMQYTASSFAEFLVRLLSPVLLPSTHRPDPLPLFPRSATFRTHVGDVVLDRAVLPGADRIARGLVWFRWLQRGSVHMYLLYILGVVLLLHFYH
jgi:hydrogenase-4 component B